MLTGVLEQSWQAHDRHNCAGAGDRWAELAWQLPAEATLIHSPTAINWLIGRTQTNGKADYNAVHKFQAGLLATPLGAIGHFPPDAGGHDQSRLGHEDAAHQPCGKPRRPAEYFSLFTELTKLNPPHANDYQILHQMRRMGIKPGKPFAFDQASREVQRALTEAGPIALDRMKTRFRKMAV